MKPMPFYAVYAIVLFCSCNLFTVPDNPASISLGRTEDAVPAPAYTTRSFAEGSWQHFLQHLPIQKGTVVDYRGRRADYSGKAFALVRYDVGTKDLQQCADALMRLRAEYLFAQKRYSEIAFHFTSGDLYSFEQYTGGIRPRLQGNAISFQKAAAPCDPTHPNLRKYLDIVYTYAGTISLSKELLPADSLTVGTVIIKPGSPGHCSIIVDEATTQGGEKRFKLAEGYTPAQSIYILRNPADGSPWYALKEGQVPIETSSYTFSVYKLGKFE